VARQGVAFPRPDDWVFPYSIALALAGIAAIFSHRAALAAALPTIVAIAIGFGFGDPEGSVRDPILAGLALVSLVGWRSARRTPGRRCPRPRLSSARRSGR